MAKKLSRRIFLKGAGGLTAALLFQGVPLVTAASEEKPVQEGSGPTPISTNVPSGSNQNDSDLYIPDAVEVQDGSDGGLKKYVEKLKDGSKRTWIRDSQRPYILIGGVLPESYSSTIGNSNLAPKAINSTNLQDYLDAGTDYLKCMQTVLQQNPSALKPLSAYGFNAPNNLPFTALSEKSTLIDVINSFFRDIDSNVIKVSEITGQWNFHITHNFNITSGGYLFYNEAKLGITKNVIKNLTLESYQGKYYLVCGNTDAECAIAMLHEYMHILLFLSEINYYNNSPLRSTTENDRKKILESMDSILYEKVKGSAAKVPGMKSQPSIPDRIDVYDDAHCNAISCIAIDELNRLNNGNRMPGTYHNRIPDPKSYLDGDTSISEYQLWQKGNSQVLNTEWLNLWTTIDYSQIGINTPGAKLEVSGFFERIYSFIDGK